MAFIHCFGSTLNPRLHFHRVVIDGVFDSAAAGVVVFHAAVPFDPKSVAGTPVGTASFTFADGNHARFAYTVDAISQTKEITREIFAVPGTVCQ